MSKLNIQFQFTISAKLIVIKIANEDRMNVEIYAVLIYDLALESFFSVNALELLALPLTLLPIDGIRAKIDSHLLSIFWLYNLNLYLVFFLIEFHHR